MRAEIGQLPEAAWHPESDDVEIVREWAEVPSVPADEDYRKDRPCVRRRQGELFADGSTGKHFAILTNCEGDGLTLIRWHREKAGTVEHMHHVLTNELAAEALPSGKCGANAAWFRLNVLTYNLLSALKRVALPGDLSEAPAEATAVVGIQHGWESRAACTPHISRAAGPSGFGTKQHPGAQPRLARE